MNLEGQAQQDSRETMSRRIRTRFLLAAMLLAVGFASSVAYELPWQIGAEVGENAIARGDRSIGEQALRKAIATAEHAAPEDPRLATALGQLANLLSDQGRYAEAETFQRRALAIRQKTFGPEHPQTAESLHDMASLYHVQGWDTAAEPLLLRALAIRRKTLGETDPLTADSLKDLADIEAATDRYDDARSHYEQALEIMQEGLGPKHPRVAPILNGLALLEQGRGRYGAADQHLKRALEIESENLAKRSSRSARVLTALESAGGALSPEIELYLERAITSARTTLKPKSHAMATIHNNLGINAFGAGRRAEAQKQFEQALAIEEALGSPTLLSSTIHYNLGRLYSFRGQPEQAKRAYERALTIAKKLLRPGHPQTLRIAKELSSLTHDEDVIAWRGGA